MYLLSRKIILFVVILLISSEFAEARRKILKGRKTINRSYFSQSIVPPWLLVLSIGIMQVAVGGILYVVMKYCILDKIPDQVHYVAAPVSP
ncbi:hypothetical protein HHI36_018178 [Cryptolaemus montrouzieri]|uniref:Uncharacterized protein n=1 Tax=Cryptolaemus montrouzieri TaxID=559131 RepID=A0ABD2NZ61_9CUCU